MYNRGAPDGTGVFCFLMDGERCSFTAKVPVAQPDENNYTFYKPSEIKGSKSVSEYKAFLSQLIIDFGGKEGSVEYNESLKFMVDSSVTLCADL